MNERSSAVLCFGGAVGAFVVALGDPAPLDWLVPVLVVPVVVVPVVVVPDSLGAVRVGVVLVGCAGGFPVVEGVAAGAGAGAPCAVVLCVPASAA